MNLISKYVNMLQEGTSLVPDTREDAAEFLSESENDELESILETIADLEEEQQELDEWIKEFDEGMTIPGNNLERTKYVASGGLAGKYGAVKKYKDARKAGKGRLKSAGVAVKKANPVSAVKKYSKDKAGQRQRVASRRSNKGKK